MKMERLDIWQETTAVRFGHIDRSGRLTLDTALRFFQEAAISHAENLGVGLEDMARTGQGWILSRMSALIERRPRYGESITIRSWPRGREKLFALRDFDILISGDDSPAVRARSCWVILDTEKRRPLRAQSLISGLPLNEGLDALPSGAAGLAERQGLQKASGRKALYTDVDYNGHVNNTRYIEWIEDIPEAALLEEAAQMRLDINYLSETLPGGTTELWSGPLTDDAADTPENSAPPKHAFAFEGRKADGGQAAFRAELRLW